MAGGLDHVVHAVRDLARRSSFIGGSASPSARATAMPGAPTIIWFSFPAFSSSC
jgi:hypothetical protein